MLQTVDAFGYRLYLSRQGHSEWFDHCTRGAATWLRKMYGRKRVDHAALAEFDSLRERWSAATTTEREHVMTKDAHLVAAALESDRRLLSGDETARGLFSDLSSTCSELSDVLWANPHIREDRAIDWLQQGAPESFDPDLRLAAFRTRPPTPDRDRPR